MQIIDNIFLNFLAHQNRTIAIASDFRVDGAKSPEIPQQEGVLGSEISARNRRSLATFHRTLKSQCSIAVSCLGNRAISGVRDGHRNRKSQKSLRFWCAKLNFEAYNFYLWYNFYYKIVFGVLFMARHFLRNSRLITQQEPLSKNYFVLRDTASACISRKYQQTNGIQTIPSDYHVLFFNRLFLEEKSIVMNPSMKSSSMIGRTMRVISNKRPKPTFDLLLGYLFFCVEIRSARTRGTSQPKCEFASKIGWISGTSNYLSSSVCPAFSPAVGACPSLWPNNPLPLVSDTDPTCRIFFGSAKFYLSRLRSPRISVGYAEFLF